MVNPKVCMLTTVHNTEIVDTGKKDRDGNPIMKPAIINDYNHHMGGVDLVDQQLHAFHVLRKTYKCYKKLVFRLTTQAVLNSQSISTHYWRHW